MLIALLFPAFLRAQFQQPSEEELKMTSDPKAPGAAAVYLNINDVTDDGRHYHSFYVRIKVLTEKGKELANVEIPYEHGSIKISDIKARTIHADGTIIPLTGKPEDLLSFKETTSNGESFQVNRKVFSLPSVEVGSILEYEYQIDYDNVVYHAPFWEIQRPYFVHKAHYRFTPFNAFMPGLQNQTSSYLVDENGFAINTLIWWPILPDGVKVITDSTGSYNVDITDVPPAPQEEWMPPTQSVLYKVLFYYKNATNASDFWITESKLWSKEVDHFAESSKSIKAAVASLTAPGDSELDKAKKLYKAVQALDNTDYSRKKTDSELKLLKLKVIKHAEDTWAQKSGSSDDIALLYLAMLRTAGLNAYAMKVADREKRIFNPAYLTTEQLDDTLVVLNIGGKETILDPGEKMCFFGSMSWRHADVLGFRQNSEKTFLWSTPPLTYSANTLARNGDITLDEHGAITGTFRFIISGQQALRWRQVALRKDITEVKKQFDSELESEVPQGIEAHIDHFLSLDDPDLNLMAIVNVRGTLGTATSKRLILPGFFFETRETQPFVDQEKRQTPVDMHYAELVSDQIVYHLPPGFSIEGAPQDAKISWPNHAVLIVKSASASEQVSIARTLARAFTDAKPEEYQDLRSFYQKIAASDQGQLVLTHSAAAKGN
jgi:hypothetical protein